MFPNLHPKLRKAASRLVTQPPAKAFHLTSILLSCKLLESRTVPGTETVIPVACTDGTNIWFNPDCYKRYTTLDLQTILAHELTHIAHLHPFRGEGRHQETWNLAIDYQTNAYLQDAGFHMPDSALIDPHFGKRTPESIYREIYNPTPQPAPTPQPGGGPCDSPETATTSQSESSDQSKDLEDQEAPNTSSPSSDSDPPSASTNESTSTQAEQLDDTSNDELTDHPEAPQAGGEGCGKESVDATETIAAENWGAVIPPMDLTFDQITEREQEIRTKMTEARIIAKSMGEHYGGNETDIPLKPLDFSQQLAGFIKSSGLERSDYTWKRPNRRYLGIKLIMPDTASAPRNDQLWVAVDTSGSVSEQALERFLEALSSILMEYPAVTITVIQCDRRIQDIKTFSHADLPINDLRIKGRGGTDFKPVFRKIRNDNLPVTALLYFTDLYVGSHEFPNVHPDFPVAWVDFQPAPGHYKVQPPFGHVINMDD